MDYTDSAPNLSKHIKFDHSLTNRHLAASNEYSGQQRETTIFAVDKKILQESDEHITWRCI